MSATGSGAFKLGDMADAAEAFEALLGQLKVGGRMVIPVGDGDTQRMWTIDRICEPEFTKKDHGYAAFVPMLEARARD